MIITLGPWKVEAGVDAKLRDSLPAAMADEAATTVSKAGHTPKAAVDGDPATKGFTISGRVTSVTTQGRTVHVKAMFDIWVDGTVSNVKPVPGDADAEGSMGAEDALRGIVESRVKKLLDAIKAGRVLKAS